MKWLPLLFLFAGLKAYAQTPYDSITFSYYSAGLNYRLNDSLQANLSNGSFKNNLSGEKKVYRFIPVIQGRSAPTDSTTNLLNAIRKNGADDVAKCFIPRHSVNYYRQGKIVEAVLICFECDGIRFSHKRSPGIKSLAKREEQMARLKGMFTRYGFSPAGN